MTTERIDAERVTIRVHTVGADESRRDLDNVSTGLRRMETATRGTLLPMLGGGILAGAFSLGLAGIVSNAGAVQNSMAGLQGALEAAFAPILNTLYPIIDALTLWVEQNPKIASGIAVIAGAMAALRVVLWAVVGVATYLMFTVLANPIGAIIAGIVALGVVVYWLATRFQTVGDIVRHVLNFLIGTWNAQIALVVEFVNLLIRAGKLVGLFRGTNLIRFGGIPTLPRWEAQLPTDGGYLLPHERRFFGTQPPNGGNVTVNNFGLSADETMRTARTEIASASVRQRADGGL